MGVEKDASRVAMKTPQEDLAEAQTEARAAEAEAEEAADKEEGAGDPTRHHGGGAVVLVSRAVVDPVLSLASAATIDGYRAFRIAPGPTR